MGLFRLGGHHQYGLRPRRRLVPPVQGHDANAKCARNFSLCSFPCVANSFACASFVAISNLVCLFLLAIAACIRPSLCCCRKSFVARQVLQTNPFFLALRNHLSPSRLTLGIPRS